jgi:hypothetical protein
MGSHLVLLVLLVLLDLVWGNYWLTEFVSVFSLAGGGDTGNGEVPSPIITTIPFSRVELAPLTAQIAPASIRLESNAMIVFFIGYISLSAKCLMSAFVC